MSKTRVSAPVILALLLASTAAIAPYALAQTAADTEPTPAPAPSETGAQSTAPSTAEVPAKSAPGDDSPFDYRSSEKISEDLSVSFPVDI